MFIPEYTVTTKIINGIGSIEYAKGVIENTVVMPSWDKQLKKEAVIRILNGNLIELGTSIKYEELKKFVDGISAHPSIQIRNLYNEIQNLDAVPANIEIDEAVLKSSHKNLSKELLPENKLGAYRGIKIPGSPNPEEILVEMVEFFDWYASAEAHETHPLIKAAITKAQIERIIPFEMTNDVIANLAAYYVLYSENYKINNWFSFEEHFNKSRTTHEKIVYKISENDLDFTEYIEYFIDNMNYEANNLKEKVKLLSRETKISKATGKNKLTPRQQRIVEYLQDYGVLYNRDFGKIFPDVSEDSVLRDLKALITQDVVIKVGTTKSSRYELA